MTKNGLINSVSTHVVEAQQAFPTLHIDIMSGLDAANNMMDSANKIASYKIDVPAASKNIGNIDLSNALRDLGADPSRVYDRKNDGDLSFVLGITPIIGTGKEIGQLIKGEDLVTGQKYGPDDYVWGHWPSYLVVQHELLVKFLERLLILRRKVRL